uniref:Uncharacterized protein n=1 Tax=Oryza punctata TaxID=4537 RepID=A0A0E0M622_ORYPU
MAGQMFTVRDVLYMYSDARTAFDRLVGIGSNLEQARNAVALLVWLDQCNHLPGLSPSAVSLFAAEANSVLDCLRWPEPVVPAIPLISALCQDGDVDPRFFVFYKDLVDAALPTSSMASAHSYLMTTSTRYSAATRPA